MMGPPVSYFIYWGHGLTTGLQYKLDGKGQYKTKSPSTTGYNSTTKFYLEILKKDTKSNALY